MSDSVDRVFVHALNTVKRIPRTGSARPPPSDRLRLYGLYKQSTEGDVDGITSRPKGDTAEIRSDQEKWDSWFDRKGLSKTEAKRQYITTLIDTMHRYASQTRDARELVSELEFVWDQIKSNPPSSSSSNSYPRPQGSGESPNSGREQLIYPVMSENGARNPGRTGKPLQAMEPISQPSSEDTEEEGEEQEKDMGARERFVDAQDSQLDGSGEHSVEDEPDQKSKGRNFSRDARAIIAPISNYLKSQTQRAEKPRPNEDASIKWQRRVESALIKMNAEVAALREQLDMQQDAAVHGGSSILPPFQRNKKQGFFGWLFSFVWSTASTIIKHVLVDAAILAIVTLVMRWRGIPAERLESVVLGWLDSVRRITLVRRVERQVARGDIRVPSTVARNFSFQTSRPAVGG